MMLPQKLIVIVLISFIASCETPFPKTVDGIAVTKGEQQAVKVRKDKKKAREGLYNPYYYIVSQTVLGTMHLCKVNIGHNNPKYMEEEVRLARQTRDKRAGLSVELTTVRKCNQIVACYCSQLLGEVDALKGRPHATISQKKDLLKEIKLQIDRVDLASKQTEQAIKSSREYQTSLGTDVTGHKNEMQLLGAEIAKLESKKEEMDRANAQLIQQRKEISS